MQKKERTQVFRDPLYGYIHVEYDFITKLIDTSIFQRLRRIKQLSGVNMVFHGAEHSRFTHSLGVYELAYRFLSLPEINNNLNNREKLLFLTSALLHDIGHGPYSHAFEYTFLVSHEKMTAKLILNHPEITNILDEIDKDFKVDISNIILKKSKFKLIEQLISSQLDIDRLDYLERDAHFTGAAYGHIDLDRLMRVLLIKNKKVVFKASGIHAIENYLVARYHMYWQVYYHPKARAYEVILEKIYLRVKELLKNNFKFTQDVRALKKMLEDPEDIYSFLDIDDFYMNGLIAQFKNSEDYILKTLSNDFLNRKIWKFIDLSKNNENKIKDILNKDEIYLKYYTSKSDVRQGAYLSNDLDMGGEINIYTEDDEIISLSEYSSIIHSLITTSMKDDPKLFYRGDKDASK